MSFKKSKIRQFSFDLDDPFQMELLTAMATMPRGHGLAAILNVLRRHWGSDLKAHELAKRMKESLYNQNTTQEDRTKPRADSVEIKPKTSRPDFSRLKI